MTLLPQPARRAILTVVLAVAFSLIAASPTAVATDSPSARDSAQALLKASSHSGGLCVILEPSDARFAIELCRGGKGLLHVLCSEQVKAADVTALADSEGLSGLVSAEDLSPRGLPYVGGTVNLLVAEDVAGLRKKGLAMDELFRVVSPGGSVCVRQAEGDLKDLEAALARRGIKEMPRVSPEGPWRVFRKPRPAEMDDWTHWNHAADGNLVSQDRLVRTPQSLQWIAGPAWSEDPPSAGALNAAPQFMLSANGRNFYLLGQGDKASLIARDAFNGVLLWIEPAPRAYKGMVLAWGDEVVLYRDGQIVALPAATGTPARTLVKTKYCIGLLCSDGTLLSIESDRLRAVELATGRELWSATNQRSALGSLVDAGKFFCLKDGQLECLGLGDGRSAWRTSMDTPPLQKSRLLLAREGLVLARTDGPDENVYRAFDASDGKARWSHSIAKSADKAYEAYNDNAYFASGLVWVQSWPKDLGKNRSGQWDGLDPLTGTVRKTHLVPPMAFYRCHPMMVTDRFMIGNRPAYFMDWNTGDLSKFDGTRAACMGGSVMAQGLYFSAYTASAIPCRCVPAAISGITAWSCPESPATQPVEADRLVRGVASPPATASTPASARADDGESWPMYRRDSLRRSWSPSAVPNELAVLWQRKLDLPKASCLVQDDWRISRPTGDGITAPVIAEGKVFVALTHAHKLVALDAAGGQEVWSFTTPGRIDAPPTIYQGLCLVGCHDGWVYALRAADGKLAWCLRAAPVERRMVACGQVESSWPVVGGVLVQDGVAYVIAGRSTEADGGLHVHAIDPLSGSILWSGRRGKFSDAAKTIVPTTVTTFVGAADLLSSDGKTLAIGACPWGRFDLKSGEDIRSIAGWGMVRPGLVHGRYAEEMLAVKMAPVAYQGEQAFGTWTDFAVKPYKAYVGPLGKNPAWKTELAASQRARLVAGAGESLLVGLSSTGAAGPGGASTQPEGAKAPSAGTLWILAAKDGAKLGESALPAAPAFDAAAIAGGRIYLCLQDGAVLCLGPRKGD